MLLALLTAFIGLGMAWQAVDAFDGSLTVRLRGGTRITYSGGYAYAHAVALVMCAAACTAATAALLLGAVAPRRGRWIHWLIVRAVPPLLFGAAGVTFLTVLLHFFFVLL